MRKLFMMAAALALPFAVGCASTGGICDCAPVPGDSTGYNPHVIYHATCPGGDAAPQHVKATTMPTSISGSTEQIGSPKTK